MRSSGLSESTRRISGSEPQDAVTLQGRVEYEAVTERLRIRLPEGPVFTIARHIIPGLEAATSEDISRVTIDDETLTLSWPELNVTFSVDALAQQTHEANREREVPPPFGLTLKQPLYCCPACETIDAGCKRSKTPIYGGTKVEDYDYV
jgi:hypothetical protein